jgi:hypothetical protein
MLCGQAGVGQAGEVERQRRRRQLELLADAARRQALGARLHQQAEDRQARTLRQGAQRSDGFVRFHISRIMETLAAVKHPDGKRRHYSAAIPAATVRA